MTAHGYVHMPLYVSLHQLRKQKETYQVFNVSYSEGPEIEVGDAEEMWAQVFKKSTTKVETAGLMGVHSFAHVKIDKEWGLNRTV